MRHCACTSYYKKCFDCCSICPSCNTSCIVCIYAMGVVLKCQLTGGCQVTFPKRSSVVFSTLWSSLRHKITHGKYDNIWVCHIQQTMNSFFQLSALTHSPHYEKQINSQQVLSLHHGRDIYPLSAGADPHVKV